MPLIVLILVVALVLGLWTMVAFGLALIALVPWIVAGLIVGWLASLVAGSPRGALAMVLLGIAGSLVGGALFSLLGWRPVGGPLSPSHLLAAFVGALLLLAIFRAADRRA